MRLWKLHFLLLVHCLLANIAEARASLKSHERNPAHIRSRGLDCAPARAYLYQEINNMRACLSAGGDLWWHRGPEGAYVAPKSKGGSDLESVSAIFAGSIWVGGFDSGNNLKIAAQTYREDNHLDWWPGPLEPWALATDKETCADWDRVFSVSGDTILAFIAAYRKNHRLGIPYLLEDIPSSLLGWPGKGNPHFKSVYGFDLPDHAYVLAPFMDQNGDDIYDPLDGDYPYVREMHCDYDIPSELNFTISNDRGGPHSATQGLAAGIELYSLSFAYHSDDEFNNMTFRQYRLFNRGTDKLDRTCIALWVDPDLGCPTDDYIGYDSVRNLMYVYNGDALDGDQACDCAAGGNTFCDHIPIFGIGLLQKPYDDLGGEVGITSFTYYQESGSCTSPAMSAPEIGIEYYYYMTSRWKDSTPLFNGGSGYGGLGPRAAFAYPGLPNDLAGWSMCSSPPACAADIKAVFSSGPHQIFPGERRDLLFGVPWAPNQLYPCPDLSEFLAAADIAQAATRHCHSYNFGPDAPGIEIVSLDQKIVLNLFNDPKNSNNVEFSFSEPVYNKPQGYHADSTYTFEGYKVYQLKTPDREADLEDPEQARLIAQSDLQNGIADIYDWEVLKAPTAFENGRYKPVLRVQGADQGIQSTVEITRDAFSNSPDQKQVNGKEYYFTAIAYAYNDFKTFDPSRPISSQKKLYLEGWRFRRVAKARPYIRDEHAPSNILVWPNPLLSEAASSEKITILGLTPESVVRIYDISGKLVQDILPNPKYLLEHSRLSWNLKDARGLRIAPGIYFIQVKTKGQPDQVVKWCYLEHAN